MTTLSPETRENLIGMAKKAYENAYNPYSNFYVGAAIMTEEGDFFTGCNIENISFGITCCSERTAAFKMISEKGPKTRIKYIAIATATDGPCTPCGMCRQVITEFGPDAIVIYKEADDYVEKAISELLPNAYNEIISIDKDGTQTPIQPGM